MKKESSDKSVTQMWAGEDLILYPVEALDRPKGVPIRTVVTALPWHASHRNYTGVKKSLRKLLYVLHDAHCCS